MTHQRTLFPAAAGPHGNHRRAIRRRVLRVRQAIHAARRDLWWLSSKCPPAEVPAQAAVDSLVDVLENQWAEVAERLGVNPKQRRPSP